jgi:8-oxo-dGTP diphosphatase
MKLYVVRHAKAGERAAWTGPDEARPLSKTGWKQARALAKRLAAASPSVLVSSPYARCVQTLEPLAARTKRPLEIDKRLAEGAPFEAVLDLLGELPPAGVLCSHGDVIPDTIEALVRRGMQLRSAPDWRKATVWVLKRDRDGVFTTATVWAPPPL